MMSESPSQTRSNQDLRAQIKHLQDSMRLFEQERKHIIEQRYRRMLIVGVSLSLLFHICLMVYLSLVQRGGGGGNGGVVQSSYQLAILSEQELSDLEESNFDDLPAGPVEDQSLASLPELQAMAAETGSASPNAIPGLGASGDGSGGIPGSGAGQGGGDGLGLGGGGGSGASFFGIASKGTRFAYIVDISGSMGQNRKLELALGELARSVASLPDFANFYVLLFSNSYLQPPMQKNWMRARKPLVRQLISWLNQVEANGGTEPRASFMQVFALEERPDVIYFLTDGQFNDITPEDVMSLNSRGKKAVINTIQFGDPNGEDILRQIAKQSGGTYRFVPAEGGI